DIQLHPLLRDIVSIPKAKNPLRPNARPAFDAASLNPYIDQAAFSKQAHRARPLELNPKGKYIEKGEHLRAQQREKERLEAERREKEAKGILPDINIQEDLFRPQMPPPVEWWDRPYLRGRLYQEFHDSGSKFVLDSETAPVTSYVQHPVPIEAPWKRTASDDKTHLFLTKDEMKRKRRNERQARHREMQDRIKLGLEPPPPPKVKLSNLMNVLTNEAIQDPTGVEMKVRQDVQERFEKHMEENEQRKLTPEQKAKKRQLQQEKELSKGYHTAVYKVSDLSDGQHFFKVDMNAKQLGLVGIVLVNPRFSLVIAEGSAKSVKFFKKLMTRRIKWQELNNGLDLRDNKCMLVWEGELRELSFQKWSPMYTKDDEEAYRVLDKFGHENYWREAF
ncbi:Pre-mRNA-splicing factor 3, partial [Metschnikowia bicuspidata var. bicuspidata NRRL YB-4993]